VVWIGALSAAALGCSDEADGLNGGNRNGNGGENGVANACGPVVEAVETECDSFRDCPGTLVEENVVPARCDRCVDFAEFRVCEAGACRRIEVRSGNQLSIRVQSNLLTEGAEGYATIQMTSLTADGRRISCRELLSTCTDYSDPRLNVFNSNAGRGQFLPNLTSILPADTIEDDDIIVVVLLTEMAQGRGDVLTVGCADGVASEFEGVVDVAIVPAETWPPEGR
jgi:hypothetical protein